MDDCDLFALTNTAMDTAINLFLLEKDGLTAKESSYLSRQGERVADILAALNKRAATLPVKTREFTDGELRLGCFLDWALFRERITLADCPELAAFLDRMGEYPAFASTAPPTG